MFIARKNPDSKHQSSSELYYEIAGTVVIPATCDFVSNADTQTIESILSNRLGIKDNQFTPHEGQSREPVKANIRHALSFCFQKQSVVAVNTQLFHRQNETYVAQWANELQLEHVNCPYRFDYKKMTVVVDLDRPVPLRQLGSGSNWLGIHLITYFAMQKYFILNKRPVPQFIFLDQISQVYFPADDEHEPVDQDRAAVEHIYKFIFEKVQELEGKLQVIIVDHAKLKNDEFKNSTCEDWWSGETLVPIGWDSTEKKDHA